MLPAGRSGAEVSRQWVAAAAALAFALGSGRAAAATLDVYGRLPSIEQMSISPDGGKLAFVTDYKGVRTVIVQTIRPNKPLAALRVSEQKLRSLDWADSDHLLITTSTTRHPIDVISPRSEWSLTQVYDVAKNSFRMLIEGVDETMNVSAGSPRTRRVGGKTTVFVQGIHFLDGKGQPALIAVDLVSGKGQLVERESPNAEDWVIDEQGKVVAEIDYVESKQHWSLRLKRGGHWHEAFGVDTAIDTPEVEGISPDGAALLVRRSDDEAILEPLSLADGAWGPPLEGDRSFLGAVEDPVTHRIIGGARATTRTEYVFFDAADQRRWNAIARAFPDEDVELESWSDDRMLVVVKVSGPRNGVVYSVVDLKAHTADLVGEIYQGLEPEDVAPVQAITYAAADGTTIPAYLTLPRNREAKDLPLVVLPHGGPAARDMPEFDWWAQALASRGYAVLQPQFRGSDGFSQALMAAGFGQWGRKMQTDLSDGVRHLVHQQIADPKRVCIVGASYGGYAALAGVTLDRGVYRCAVSVAGLSDLHRFLAWRRARSAYSKSRTLRYWDRFMGVASPEDPALDKLSPVKLAAKADAPVLLIHGRDDTVVPLEQSQAMASALKDAGKPAQLVVLAGEDHWLSRSETRLQMLEAIVGFLETNNPPR
jgi:dipeptidyl aminopeptidase/acylaminoacyl peptidase